MKKLFLTLIIACFGCSVYAIGLRELGDSLTAYTGFSRVWSPPVRVKNMRIDGDHVTLRTNATLSDVSWTTQKVQELQRKVSLWTLGHGKGDVTILTGQYNIADFITDRAKGISTGGKRKDLSNRNIALWPSHGLYYNQSRDEWIWQRATLWTTVEDLYSQEYVRLLRQMLINAGAEVHMPRAGLENNEIGASGMPQWTEGARYWLKSQGVDKAIWDLYEGNEYKDDMKCRALWVNSLDVPVDLCMALHTDGIDSGDDSTIIGTLCIYTAHDDDGNKTLRDGRERQMVNRNLADWIQTQVTQDLQAMAPEWTRRQLHEANYCESRVPVVPSVLVELLSHKNMADMRYGLNPAFRMAATRAIYKGILRYLNGKSAVVQPLPVEQLRISKDGLLEWQTVTDSLEPSAKATYYLVYVQENDGEWNVQQVEQTHIQLPIKQDIRYSYYVVAGNDGGLSFPSPVISAYLASTPSIDKPVLVIDGFSDVSGPEWFADSTYAGIVPGTYACENQFTCAYIGEQWDFTRRHPWVNDDNCGWGACYRDHAGELTIGNTHDYSVLHGRVLRKMKISYVSSTEAMAQIDSTYALVDYVGGRQRMPLSDTLRAQLTDYMNNGGKLLLSSDHLSAVDKSWVETYLHCSPYAQHATRSGRIVSPRHRLYQLVMEPNPDQLFTCTPEALKPVGDEAKRWANYEDMRCPAAVEWQKKTLVFGFPLEATIDFERIYRHAVKWLTE